MICDSTKCPEREPTKREKKKVVMEMGWPTEVIHLELPRLARVGRQEGYVLLRFHDPCYPENIWPREERLRGGELR